MEQHRGAAPVVEAPLCPSAGLTPMPFCGLTARPVFMEVPGLGLHQCTQLGWGGGTGPGC